ncbi:MAG: NAD-dependent epimerase/dehydratase family protein [Saprospiraceae bacterium]|nr:NAD-dependent epimerase/dehydratase family protein [Saprospiraceae bacterium]
MKKVFITGGTGFVGAYLIAYLLEKGYQVRALKRKTSPMGLVERFGEQVEWVEGSLLDSSFLEKILVDIDHVYHAAAMISFAPDSLDQMLKVNTEGTANIVNAALYVGIEKFLQVSSIAALGHKENRIHMTEKSEWENSKYNTGYAISKFKAECEVWRGIEEGLNAVIINPSMIMGAGYWGVGTNNLLSQIEKERGYYPEGKTGFVDVRDVAKIAIALMESDISAERFLISAENWTYKDLFDLVSELLGRKTATKALPNWLGSFLSVLDWMRAKLTGKPRALTKEIFRGMQAQRNYSNDKIKDALEVDFIPIEQTLRETVPLYLKAKQTGQSFDWLEL